MQLKIGFLYKMQKMNYLSFDGLLKFFFFFTFCISLTLSLSSDGLSLLALKAAILEDPTQALISWSDSDSTPCSWDGITCDHTHRRVTSISLSSKNLTGYIPSEIGALSFLTFLDLSQNFFSGPLPQHISKCTAPETQNPRFLNNPQKPENGGVASNGVVENRKIKGGSVTVSVISGVSLVVGMVSVSVWLIKKKWKMEQGKLGKENVSREVVGVGIMEMGNEEGQKGKFVILDDGFGLELEDLLRASAYVVGKSRSGIVYKVVVGGGGKGVGSAVGSGPVVVAVRRLSEGDATWKFKEFEAEVAAIGKVQHPNIVSLKAYYYASDEKLLISDFIKNGSLYTALHGGPGNTLPPLSWAARLRIIQETARGLMHIHECSPRKYIHGNIKSSKILLDDNLRPYISGFGLSRLVPNTSKSAYAASKKQNLNHQDILSPKCSVSPNTMYKAPEARVASTKFTQKCDVYSFGVLLLEILTGRVPNCGLDNDGKGLEGLVRKVFREERPLSEIIDPALLHEVHAKKQVVATFHIALNCTEVDPELRPKMRTVCDNLESIKLR
ncbi:Serine/threonine protein kinase [Handroanthus impetiginosus]|uniref:Serine/threonine protein kinase n=1 Tax=Handroanthus impetiginosus TaxID=429701 RepID=A0A2G9H7C2_9LAMI|nr:Serine/threonine protein kinase [Handroanthus impetiginosus]